MSGIRSAAALRRLYERYRTATTLKTSARRPGEWLAVKPGTEDAAIFEAALGVAPETADAALKELADEALNGSLGIRHELDVRLTSYRTARSTSVFVRFFMVPLGRKLKGWVPPPRTALPAAATANLTLDLGEDPVRRQGPVRRQNSVTLVTADSNEETVATEAPTEASETYFLPDGSPLPDLSMMLLPHELVELWQAGKLDDLDAMDALFAGFAHLLPDIIEEDVIESMLEGIRTNAVLQSSAPAIGSTNLSEARPWQEVANATVSETVDGLRSYRMRGDTGRLFVLAPSPGTGKSHGMMKAAAEEQVMRRRVGYAVSSRAQLDEAKDRLLNSGSSVSLIVIEGRHDGNCDYFEQVSVATDAGFSPGSAVCPVCPKYPTLGYDKRGVCKYYSARLAAAHNRRMSTIPGQPAAAIILTTHASAIQGSRIAGKRFQGFWAFDSLFIDEDPTAAMVQPQGIPEESLTYSNRDSHGRYDGPTVGTMVLRDAMQAARRQRVAAEASGWLAANGESDRIHSRDYGSSYAGCDLQALLEPIARNYGYTLAALSVAVVDGMTERPPKGEIMTMNAAEVAAKYPNRHLASFFNTISTELAAVAEARMAKAYDLEPAYRAHLDLSIYDDGKTTAAATVNELHGYVNDLTNIIVGDAYANVEHYEGLFSRYRYEGKVDVIKHRALWPTSSTLVRVVTHAGNRDVDNVTKFRSHLDTKVRPLLELERGRRIVFYVHKALKNELREWVDAVRDELGLGDYAIEHWGSGRGKDTYKEFGTFIGVTEYVPNVNGLIHEANTVAALASPGNVRVAHWNGYAKRTGSMSFANSIGAASPFYQAAFQRKAVDELAQAIHRIRPAIPSADGSQKRAYVLGHRVPWTDELVAATVKTAVVDNGNGPDLETEALGRGPRFSILDTLGLTTVREIAGAIASVIQTFQCWSHAFIHAVMGVPSWGHLEDAIINAGFSARAEPMSPGLLRDLSLRSTPGSYPLADRILAPPQAWSSVAQHVNKTSDLYRNGLSAALETLGVKATGRIHLPWMPRGSRGYEFWGSGERFEQVLASYAPGATRIPF